MGDVLRRLIAFDLDGTLIDSRQDLANSANQLIEERGGTPLPDDAIVRMVGEGAAVLVSRAMIAAGLPISDDPLARFLEIYDARLLDHTRTYEGIRGVLEALRRAATLTVLTNKPLAPTLRLLDALDLRRYFSSVLGGDEDVPRKPDPAGLLRMMASAGASAGETVLVGDSLVDVRTAEAAGCAFCWAAYGFGGDSIPAERRATLLSADSPADLLPLLASHS